MTVPEHRVDLRELEVGSGAIDDVTFSDSGGSAELLFSTFDGPDSYSGGLRFRWPRAWRHRAESHCTDWHMDAYDTLQEIEGSQWVAELVDATDPLNRGLFEMHHYVIYLRNAGCYEVIAESWESLPDVVGEPS